MPRLARPALVLATLLTVAGAAQPAAAEGFLAGVVRQMGGDPAAMDSAYSHTAAQLGITDCFPDGRTRLRPDQRRPASAPDRPVAQPAPDLAVARPLDTPPPAVEPSAR